MKPRVAASEVMSVGIIAANKFPDCEVNLDDISSDPNKLAEAIQTAFRRQRVNVRVHHEATGAGSLGKLVLVYDSTTSPAIDPGLPLS